MIYYEVDPLAVAGQKVLVKGMEEAGFKVKGIPVQDSPYNIWLNPDDKVNKTLNLRGVNWCSDWPSGLTMLPPLLKTGAAYNTAHFSEKSVDDEMAKITDHAAGRAGRRVGRPGREGRDRVLPDHPDRVPQRPVPVRLQDRQPGR